MKRTILALVVTLLVINSFAGTSKNRPTSPRDPKKDERPKRGNAPWPIPPSYCL
jgi:hypothetical protein